VKLFGDGALQWTSELVIGDHVYLQGMNMVFSTAPTYDFIIHAGDFSAWSASNIAGAQEYAISYTAAKSTPPCVFRKVHLLILSYLMFNTLSCIIGG